MSETTEIKQACYTGERALFGAHDLHIYHTVFQSGESPLKESRNLSLDTCIFQWKYPLWYAKNIHVTDSTWTEMARAGVWYTDYITVEHSAIAAKKNFRRCHDVSLTDVSFADAAETLWECEQVNMHNVTAKGDYFAMNSRDIEVDGLTYQEGLNATLISGGKGTNVIPDECRVHVNYRFAPDKSLAEAKALMIGADAGAKLGNGEHQATGGVFEGFGIEMKDESPSARPGLNSPLAQSLVSLVKERTGRDPLAKLGWTDVARFAILGIPAVNLGAGSPLLAHKQDEQLPETDLLLMADLLEDWLR